MTYAINLSRAIVVSPADQYAMRDLSRLVFECEDLYPGIDVWFTKKVVSGLSDGSRVAFLAYEGMELVGGTILRRTGNAKVCNLRIRHQFAGRGYGTGLFSLAARAAAPFSSELHFTAPEELASTECSYFQNLGFRLMGAVSRQYRRGQSEFSFCATVSDVIARTSSSVSHDLFGAELGCSRLSPWLVFSIHQKYAEQIMRGRKTIELRKRFSHAHRGARILVYSTKPQQAVVGTARISKIESSLANEIDEPTLESACVERNELMRYVSADQEVWKIHLADVIPLEKPIPLRWLSESLNIALRPPQSFGLATPGSAWGRVADLLSLNCKIPIPDRPNPAS